MKNKFISQNRINRIKEQGYKCYSDLVINDLAFGNRFTYQLCAAILLVGVYLCNFTILSTMMGIAFLGVVLPNHPFDYIYNYFLAKRMGKPQLPPRSKQLKFACTIATICLGTTMYLASEGMMTAAFILGYSIVASALLVSTTDFCIPSIVYNAVEKVFSKKSNQNIKVSQRS